MESTANKMTTQLVLAAVMASVMAVLAQVSIPFVPVPISLSTLGVYLCGLLLPLRSAVLAQGTYIALGCAGLPVFSGWRGGLQHVVGPTGGYIVSYIAMVIMLALAMPWVMRGVGKQRQLRMALLLVLATVVCYTLGSLWYVVVSGTSFTSALGVTALPFIPGDAAKILLCICVVPAIFPRLQRLL